MAALASFLFHDPNLSLFSPQILPYKVICELDLNKKNTYMLFAGWEVRMVKNCDRGLENAGRKPRAAFSRPRSQFFTIRTDP